MNGKQQSDPNVSGDAGPQRQLGDAPMRDQERERLKQLADELGTDFDPNLTQDEASQLIGELEKEAARENVER